MQKSQIQRLKKEKNLQTSEHFLEFHQDALPGSDGQHGGTSVLENWLSLVCIVKNIGRDSCYVCTTKTRDRSN